MKQRTRILLFFLLKIACIYGVLLAALPVLDGAYGAAYRKCGDVLFGRILDNGFVMFQPGKEAFLTHIAIGNMTKISANGRTRVVQDDINTRQQGYMATILFIALVLSTPVPWKRRVFAFITGLIAVSGLVMLKLWIHLLIWCDHFADLSLLVLSPGWKGFLVPIHDSLYAMIYPTLFFVVAVWLLLTLRKDDMKLLA